MQLEAFAQACYRTLMRGQLVAMARDVQPAYDMIVYRTSIDLPGKVRRECIGSRSTQAQSALLPCNHFSEILKYGN